MSQFARKRFNGTVYDFTHLESFSIDVPLDANCNQFISMHVEFGCHCFTEGFDTDVHLDHHKYVHNNELRAFDVQRYNCSLELPGVIESMLRGMIYLADNSFTYAAHIQLNSTGVKQTYSVFFSLRKDQNSNQPALKMFVKSAYLKPLVASSKSWRFPSLAGQIAGVFSKKKESKRPKKQKDKKKKTP